MIKIARYFFVLKLVLSLSGAKGGGGVVEGREEGLMKKIKNKKCNKSCLYVCRKKK